MHENSNFAIYLVHAISYCTAKKQAQIVPGPSTQPQSGESSQAVICPVHWLEGSPEWHCTFEHQQNEIFFPELQPLERVYSRLMGNLAQQIHDMGESKRINVAGVIQQLLRKPLYGVLMGDMPDIPTGSKELYSYIANRSNCLKSHLIEEVVKVINADELSDLWKDYEGEWDKCLEKPLYAGKRKKITLIQTDDTTTMAVKIDRNPEQLQICHVADMQDYIQKPVGLDGATVQGYTSSCTLLYFAISKAAVPFIPSLLLSHVAQLRRLEVQKIAVFGYFAVDLKEAQAYALVSTSFSL